MSLVLPAPAARKDRRAAWLGVLFRIRTKLLLVHAFLVVVPLAGLSFARTYERELLRSEEEGMVALAAALAQGLGAELAADHPALQPGPAITAAAHEAKQRLHAHIRVLDDRGHVLMDTGPELIELRTRGRQLLSRADYRSPQKLVVADPDPPGGAFATRPEVKRALGGQPGTATRRPVQMRGVRLYVAEPVRTAGGAVAGVVYVSRTTYPVLVSLYRVRNGLFRVAGVSLIVALVVASFLALTISRPLQKLTQAARRIAAGERGVALNLSGRDEIADLARAFDGMAKELDARLSYISELAANVSHEFKTPIAAIRGAAELLREGAADDPVARATFLGNILGDTERLARLVSRLLELSRIEAHLEPAVPLDYRALVEELVGRYAAPGRDVSLRYDARYAHLRGSSEHIESVLKNLIDNALQFSPPGAPVSVHVTVDEDGALRTEVRDRGSGISPANLGRVWDRFFTTARREGGTGLGLAIVRAIVEAHGGQTGVRSQPQEGSTFWFILPRRL